MAIADSLLPEFDHEMATTRRLLERTPEQDFAWKPHEKSMSLGQLTAHLANLPWWCSVVLDSAFFDINSPEGQQRSQPPASVSALLADFDTKVAAARASLAKRTDPEMLTPWSLKQGDHEIFTVPKVGALRTFVMNHSIHHRGQLSVYLRLRNVPLPSIYGPTADEA
jgi:uncharacterized damage-inducible protein DinB